MTFARATCLLFLLLSQKELEPTTPEQPERIRVLAIEATKQDNDAPSLDPSLDPVREFLETLPYDTFREITFHDVEASYGEDRALPLNDTYTLHCVPQRLSEEGEVVLEAYVSMKEGDSEVEALRVSGRSARGKGMVFRGFALESGEMVIILSIAEAPREGSGSGGSESSSGGQSAAGSDGGESGESGGETGQGDGGTEPEESPAEPEVPEMEEDETSTLAGRPADQADEEQSLPPELANLEGILRALEAIDEREQNASRGRRFETRVRGDWW